MANDSMTGNSDSSNQSSETTSSGLSYKDAGVDIDAGNALIDRIKPFAKRTARPESLGGLGGFGALMQIPQGYKEPILVSGTDGVGTKLRLAIDLDMHQTVGIDLVAMCVNDLVVTGAEPLFFLDYFATGTLDVDTAATVIEGIAKGCELAGCALSGGETAEMPGMYEGSDYDLAGFCVGVVEKADIIDGSDVAVGDALIALASSGAHSNGYSLIRKVIDHAKADLNTEIDGVALKNRLMEPTRIYVKSLLELAKQQPIHALAHITGGGLLENLPRVLPENACASIDGSSWEWPALFKWLQEQGQIDGQEMLRTFNCGVGMVAVVPKAQLQASLDCLNALGETAWCIGEIIERNTGTDAPQVTIK